MKIHPLFNVSIICCFVLFIHPSWGEDFKEHIFYTLKRQARESTKQENIFLDNRFIQSYKNQIGLWRFLPSQKVAKNMAQNHGVQLKQIYQINNLEPAFDFDTWIFIPYAKARYKQLLDDGISRQRWPVSKGRFIWPVIGSQITSRVGKRWGIHHSGLDIATGSGSIVLAAQGGTIISAGLHGGYGIMISIKHTQGYITHYAHLSMALAKEGDVVNKGQIVALSGNSGRSTGPHLHFEVECANITLDPEDFLPHFEGSMESSHHFHAKIFDRLKRHN